jgi:hypothetical protein
MLGRRQITSVVAASLLLFSMAQAETPLPNVEIEDNFVGLAFDQASPLLEKFVGPLHVAIEGAVSGDVRAKIEQTIALLQADIRTEIARANGESANVVFLLIDSETITVAALGKYRSLAREFYASDEDMQRKIGGIRQTSPCVYTTMWANEYNSRRRLLILIAAKREKQKVDSCITVSSAHGLGLVAIPRTATDSALTLGASLDALTEQDHLLLRILYDSRLKAGITAEEARRRVREILHELRPDK